MSELMKFQVSGKTYELPKKLKVKQFLLLDMHMLMRFTEGKIDYANPVESQNAVKWLVGFLQKLGTDVNEDDFEQLFGLLQHTGFMDWMTGLFGNLAQSKS